MTRSPIKKFEKKSLESFENVDFPEHTKINNYGRLTKKAATKELEDVVNTCRYYLNSYKHIKTNSKSSNVIFCF